MNCRSPEEIIILEVGKGDKKVKCSVHKNIICAASSFFEAACKPEWMKPEDRVIKLPEDDPKIIQMIIYWAYHDTICIPEDSKDTMWDTDLEEALETDLGLSTKIYLIAEKYQVHRLKNDAIDTIIEKNSSQWLPVSLVSHAYGNTIPDSRLRRLMLNIVRFDFTSNGIDFESYAPLMCCEFLVDLAMAQFSIDGDKYAKYVPNASDVQDPQHDSCKRYHSHVRAAITCENGRRLQHTPH